MPTLVTSGYEQARGMLFQTKIPMTLELITEVRSLGVS